MECLTLKVSLEFNFVSHLGAVGKYREIFKAISPNLRPHLFDSLEQYVKCCPPRLRIRIRTQQALQLWILVAHGYVSDSYCVVEHLFEASMIRIEIVLSLTRID